MSTDLLARADAHMAKHPTHDLVAGLAARIRALERLCAELDAVATEALYEWNGCIPWMPQDCIEVDTEKLAELRARAQRSTRSQ